MKKLILSIFVLFITSFAFSQEKPTRPDLKDYKFEINPHYSGNFWWANSSYIQKLDLDYIYNEEKGWTRWKSEFWIGTKNPNFKSYHNSGKGNLYDFSYSPDNSTMSKIREILNKFDINGHDKIGGTDKDSCHSYVEI